MSKEIEWGFVHGEGDIVCYCDHCGAADIDYKEAQNELKAIGWISRKIDGEWFDFCCEQCFYDYIKQNK